MKKIFFSILGCLFFCSHAFAFQSLQSVVQHTLKTNPTIDKERLLTRISKYERYQAVGNFLPSVNIGGDLGREYNKNPIEMNITDSDSTNFSSKQFTAQLIQPVFTGFRNHSLLTQRSYEFKAQLFTLLDAKQLLALSTIESYLNVIYDENLVALANNNVQTHIKYYTLSKLKTNSGAGRKTDIDLASARLSIAQAALETTKINLANEKALFKELSNLPPIKLQEPKSVAHHLPKTYNHLKQIVLNKNIQLQEAYENSSAAHAGIKVAKSTYYPHLDIEASHLTGNNIDGISGDVQNNSLFLTLSMNLFNGGIDYFNVQKAEAESAISIEDIASVHRNIIQEANSLWYDLHYSMEQQKQLKNYVDAQTQVVNGYQLEFKLGKRSLLNLLDVENELFQARKNLLINALHIKIVRYQLLSLMGKLLFSINT